GQAFWKIMLVMRVGFPLQSTVIHRSEAERRTSNWESANMTKMRRLLIVVAGLAAVAVVSSSSSRGNAKDKKPLLEGERPPLQGQATVEADMAVSRFADRATITYQPLKGDLGYFALQVKPKLDPIPGRPRDILVLMSMA